MNDSPKHPITDNAIKWAIGCGVLGMLCGGVWGLFGFGMASNGKDSLFLFLIGALFFIAFGASLIGVFSAGVGAVLGTIAGMINEKASQIFKRP